MKRGGRKRGGGRKIERERGRKRNREVRRRERKRSGRKLGRDERKRRKKIERGERKREKEIENEERQREILKKEPIFHGDVFIHVFDRSVLLIQTSDGN